MPYELEYKKVHNTLSRQKYSNAFGYKKGQIINRVEWDSSIASGFGGFLLQCPIIDNETHQYVLYNQSNSSITVAFAGWSQDFQGQCITAESTTIPGQSSIIIEIPNQKYFFFNGEWVCPTHIWLATIDYSYLVVWPTSDGIYGEIDENDILVTENFKDSVILSWKEDDDIESVQIFLNESTIQYSENENILNIQTPSYNGIENILTAYGLDLVLIPYCLKIEGQARLLRSITNTRNSRQFSLYGDYRESQWQPMSVYIEPIILNAETFNYQEGTGQDTWTIPQISLPALSSERRNLFTRHPTNRNNTSYGLKDAQYLLAVCAGTGYKEGENRGSTTIGLRLGVRLKDPGNQIYKNATYNISKIGNRLLSISINRKPLKRIDNQDSIINWD